ATAWTFALSGFSEIFSRSTLCFGVWISCLVFFVVFSGCGSGVAEAMIEKSTTTGLESWAKELVRVIANKISPE
ncbi:MAG: hypothetical protein WCG31_11955, partial [Deltaproteobacteria bacterium]